MVCGVGGRWATLDTLDGLFVLYWGSAWWCRFVSLSSLTESHGGFSIPLSYSQALVIIRSSNAHGVDLFRGYFCCFAPLRRRKRSHLVIPLDAADLLVAAVQDVAAMARVSGYSHIDISESHKLNNEGDEFIGREERKPGGLHFSMATYQSFSHGRRVLFLRCSSFMSQ
ncbi:hypothetical protein Tco_0278541 [Tanacetum coccineum]